MQFNLQAMIGAIVVVVIGVILFPLIQAQVTYLTVPSVDNDNTTYMTGATATLVEQLPLFYVLGLIFVALAWVIHSSKGM
jgi:hypothetical protein